MLRDRAKAALVRSHRVVLVVSTLLLGVFASRVATDMQSLGDWLITLGAALGIFVSDLCRELDDAARVLSGGSQQKRAKARIDVFNARSPGFLAALAALAVGLALAGLVIALGLVDWV